MAGEVAFSRVFVEMVGLQYGSVSYDFAYGEYLATESFFFELTEIQANLLSGETFSLPTGQEIDPQSPGGMIAIQLYMEALDAKRLAAVGLSKAGLNAEKQTWKNL